MKASESLLKARELVAAGWCQFDNALDNKGRSLRWPFANAVCFCINGALLATQGGYEAQRFLEMELGEEFYEWNDEPERTHLEVVEALERAAVRAMEAGE